jgi:hypothetical protein
MACIPVYKGKKFSSTKKLIDFLSTEEGIMAHLADGKDAEFTKAVEDAVGIAEKTISKKAAPVAKEKAAPTLRDVEFTMRRPEKNEIVFVPIDALLKKHAADQPSLDIQKEGNRIKGRVEKAKEFLKNYLNDQRAINPKTGERMKSKVTFEPSVVDIDENGKISFEDGRHRVLAAKELGITEVPIEVPKGKVKAVESLLSKEEGKPKPESKPKAEKEGAKESLAKRLKGDALLDAEDTLAELSDNGATINPDGTVVVYHRTTKDKADAIVKNNEMFGLEDGVFFSTSEKGQAEGYGDVVVKMNVPIEQIQIDDTFGNEAHVRIPTKKANQKIPVSNFSPQLAKPKADPFATFDTKGEEKALAEKEFYKKYTAQHKDIRAQSLEEKQATKNKILAEGFKEQGRNVNALPIYRGPDGTITDKQYGNKKGDFVYLLPKEGVVNTRNGYVNKAGYIPGKFDVVEIEYDGQPTYEAYSNQFKKADNPFSVFDTKGEDARKVREALKQEVGPEMFRQMQLAHKNAEKILRSFPESFKIDCP